MLYCTTLRENRSKLCGLCNNSKITVPRRTVAHVFCTQCTAARELVSKRVAVWWPGDETWFEGQIKKVAYEYEEHIFFISYDDGAKLWHSFADEKVEFISKRSRESPVASSSTAAAPEEEQHDQQEEEKQLALASSTTRPDPVDQTPEAQETESLSSEQSTISASSSISEKFAASLECQGVSQSVATSLGWHLQHLQTVGDAASTRRKARSILSNMKTNHSLREQIEQTSPDTVFKWTFEDMANEDVREGRKKRRIESVEWHTLPAVVTPGEMQKLRERAVEAKESSMDSVGRHAAAVHEPETQPEKRRVTFALQLNQTHFYTPQPPLGRIHDSFFGVLDANEVAPLVNLRDDAVRQPTLALPPPALAWETREETRLGEETHQRYQPPVPRIQWPSHQRYQEPPHQRYQGPSHQRYQEPPHQRYQVPSHQRYQVPSHQRYQGPSPRYEGPSPRYEGPRYNRDNAPSSYQEPSPRYYHEESSPFSRRTGFSDDPRRTGFSPRF